MGRGWNMYNMVDEPTIGRQNTGANRIKIIAAVIAILFSVNMPFHLGSMKAQDSWPVADGTFIQPFLVMDWDDEKWIKELQYLKDAGMNYIILASTADRINGGKIKTVYPTNIQGFQMHEGYTDVVDACLRNAQSMGLKVFVGLNSDSGWWDKYGSESKWLYKRMNEGNSLADELYSLYYHKYPDAFHGWYWPWEVDNFHFKRPEEQKVLINAINISLNHFESTNKRLPFMFSPYMNYWFGDAEEYKKLWINIFANTNLKKGDIFCPQDSVGAGGLDVNSTPIWFAALRQAVDSKPGLLFWANTENFDISSGTSATLDRFVIQLKNVQPYVDNIVTFAYSHYYSPNVTNSGFHRSYLYYVKNGVIKNNVPSVPSNVEKKILNNGHISLTWHAPEDYSNVCGYLIYRDGRLIKRMQVPEKETYMGDTMKTMVFIDSFLGRDIFSKYEVKVFDFWGNISKNVIGNR